MKKILILILLLSSISIYAQDVITLRTGEQIKARVTEISQTELRYKRFEHLDGPTIVVPLSTIFAINYENGTREVINPLTETSTTQPARGTEQNTRTQTQHQPPNRVQNTSETRSRAQTTTNTFGATKAFGGNLVIGMGNDYTHLGLGAKFFYSNGNSNNFRVATEFDFFPKQNLISWWDFSVYSHYLISAGEQITLYPLAGLGFVGMTAHLFGEKFSEIAFAFSLGGGIDIAVNSNLTLSGELRFKFLDGGYRTNIAIGLTHKF